MGEVIQFREKTKQNRLELESELCWLQCEGDKQIKASARPVKCVCVLKDNLHHTIRRMLLHQMETEEKLSECHHEEQIANSS